MIHSILAQPLPVRCDAICQLVEECTNKELDTIFTTLVQDIFGIGNQTGWGLRSIQYNTHPTEYDMLFKFLHPQGPVFRLCYKLLVDCYRKYEYQLTYLPKKVRQCIEDGNVPSFYSDKLLFDHKSRTPLALALNPFEYYMFHFAYHLVNPWINVTCEGNPNNNWLTLYLRLAEEYLTVFLPCDGSPILPLTPYYVGQGPTRTMQIHTMTRPPVRTPTLFRQSVLLKQSPTVNTLHTTTQTSPHVEIWRSELILQLCLDFWLTTSSDTDNVWYHPQLWSTPPIQMLQQNVSGQYMSTPLWKQQLLPSGEHLRVVRFFVKHLHFFANSHIEDSSAMDELQRVILPSSQCKLYQFLRQTMQHWPLDYSFRLILEAWLSYIQPWRYSDYKTGSGGGERPIMLERRWLPFIAENLLAYTLVFQELITRFCRIDLATPKNALMLFRVTKVFAQPNLNLLIKEAEESISEGGSRTSCSKWGGIVRTHFLELEGPGFVYQPLFSSETQAKVMNFIAHIKQTELIAQRRVDAETSSSNESGILSWLFQSISTSEYTVDERKKVFTFLAASIANLGAIFGLDEACISHQTSVLDTTLSTSDMNVTPNIMNLTPADMNRSLHEIKYQGDPDLHPVKSYESACLVRLLYQAATWINSTYPFEVRELYARDDLVGGIARQLLWGPTVIHCYDKRKPGYSPRVQVTLPPRVSFRYWANQRVLVSFLVYALLGKFILGYPVVFVWFVIFFVWCAFLIFKHLIGRSPKPVRWRDSLNDNSNLSF